MIFTDRTIIVQKGTSSINDTIILYRGDKDVEIRFTLNEGSPFRFGSGASPNIIEKTEAAYGQLIIKTPNDLPAIFSEVAPTNNGKIVFTITAEMIDEITEVGNYTFQIRLLDESRNSRATIPEVVNGIEIREPIATEDVSTSNEVGEATVGYALTTAATAEDTFDTQGNYNKTTWGTGDRITAAKLNKIEAGIDGVNKKVASGGTGGTVDLSGYVTKETGNANQITFADGQTFQAKLEAGTLKGEKGDKGDQGPQGIQGPKGDSGADNINDTTASAITTYSSNKIESIKEGLNSQIRVIENYSLVKHTDGKVYIKKQDGTLIGTGVEVGGNTDLSKVTMSMDGQTLKLLNDGTQIATVEIPTATVTDEQLTAIIQSKIDDGTLTSLALGDNSVSTANLQDKSITPNKTTFFKEELINFALNIGTLGKEYNGPNTEYTKIITDYIYIHDNLNVYIKSWKMKNKGDKNNKPEVACYDSEKNYLGMGTSSYIESLTETDSTTTYYFWINSATLLESTKYIRIGYYKPSVYLTEGIIVSSKTIKSNQTVDELEFSITDNYYEPLFNALIKDKSVGIEKINGTFTPSTTNFMIESPVNMINPAEVLKGKFFNSATTDSIRGFDATTVTGYIEVELGGKYYFYRENTSLDHRFQKIIVRGYDSNKTYIGILYGEFDEHDDTSTAKGVSEFEITDENVKFVRFYYRHGENVILSKYNLKKYYAYEEYSSLDLPVKYKEFFIRNIMMSEITKALIKDNVSAVALEQNMRPLYNKKWVQIGDSLTDWGGGEHVDVLSQDLRAMDKEGDTGFMRFVRDKEGVLFYNQGFAGAQWQLTKIDGSVNDGQGNSITSEPENDKYCAVRRVDKLIENKAAFTPDIITILMGTNCADEGETTDTSDNLYTMCGAIKYCLENLLREFPTTPIGILLPPQRLEGNGWQEPRNEKIRTIAQYYSIPVLDLFHEGQIVPANRVVVDGKPTSGNGSLTDGLHLGDVGKINLGRKLCNWLKTL